MSENIRNYKGALKKPNLSNEQRQGVLQYLLKNVSNEKLKHGAIKQCSTKFNVCTRTINRIWNTAKQDYNVGSCTANVVSKKKGNSGRKRKDREGIKKKISEVSIAQRSTIRNLCNNINQSLGTVHRILKEGVIRRVSSTVKPVLTDDNKKHRLVFVLCMLQEPSLYFQEMLEFVHIDEKWFYITKTKINCYLLPEEETPNRTCKSKTFLTKVMFLAAVARPRYDYNKKAEFNAKIGLWPIVTQEPAKRNSKNRIRGTLMTTPVEVTRQIYVDMITKKVIPVIKEKWPKGSKKMPIKIQQDNARPHCSIDDGEVIRAGTADGWNISLICQPPSIPDFNLLDLGFLNAIQSIQHKSSMHNIDELIAAVLKA
ncbi:uncharacterized protein [Onthophagus taurus]|uniref:uncharacterized protein n=1 Tax=Onthophagus taurus TaxID=166361 RepID=UPI0039BDF854